MSYIPVYSRINWENEPSINTPINATNLNAIDYAVYTHDQTLVNWDTTKANQSDLLLSVKSVDYDTETGVFVFTWQNGTTKTVDLNIEKIPVSFSMSPAGVITMTTEDGTQYTADVGSLIKTYSFNDSSVIDFTVTTDASGNKTVTADIVDGSITGQKLQPNYLADCVSAKTDAETAEGLAEDSAEDSEAWANGTRNGVPVTSSDPAYHNNSKYWSEQSNPTSLVGLTDTDINNPTNGQTLIYNSTSQKWENQNGGSASLAGLSDVDLTTPTDGQVLTYDSVNQEWVNADIGASGGSNITVTTTEATLYGQNVTITDGVTTLTETFSPSGVALFEGVTMTGQLTIASGAFSTPLNVPYFGNYNPVLSGFTATITVTFPADSTCTCTKSGETQTAYVSPHTFSVHSAGTYTITATDGTHTKSDTVTITTDGQSESVTLTYVPDGSTVLPTDDIQIWLNCADIYDKTSYTTLSDVLADSTTLSTLIADNNAVDYMVRSKSWASNKGLVPTMTSNTTPSGVCSAYNTFSTNFKPYYAFDDNSSTEWTGGGDGPTSVSNTQAEIIYQFPTPTLIRRVVSKIQHNGSASWKVRGSNDGNTWVDLSELKAFVGWTWVDIAENISNTTEYIYYELYFSFNSETQVSVRELQFYSGAYEGNGITEDSTAMSYIGLNNYCANTLLADSDWLTAICNSTYFESVLNVKVPAMTSNNTPSGVASASSEFNDNLKAYKAFDGNDSTNWGAGTPSLYSGYIRYQFPSAVCVRKAVIHNSSAGSGTKSLQLQVSNDGTTFTTIGEGTVESSSYDTVTIIGTNNTNYTYCQIAYSQTQDNGASFSTVQFYGRIDV